MARIENGQRQKQKANTGVLRCAQDDGVKQATARATATAKAKTNTEILSFAQNDDMKDWDDGVRIRGTGFR
jgi:methylaspartate ammonia-lyase